MTNDYRITPAAMWDGPPGTGHHQAEAGRGDHAALSAQRWAARRAWMPTGPRPVEQQPNVVLDTDRSDAFVQGIANSLHRDVGRDRLAGAVLGGLVGFALSRNKNRRT
jgi:hypothetical protein